jgi:hypothetical protein
MKFAKIIYEKCSQLKKKSHNHLKSPGIFIFGGGIIKRLRNVTKMYCQCQISHKRRKKECLGKFKFSLNRLKKQILRIYGNQFLSVLQKEKLFSYNQTYYKLLL